MPTAGRRTGVRPLALADSIRTAGRRRETYALVQLLELAPHARLLDVGGGSGAFTARFTASVRDVIVLEPDPRAIRVAGRRRAGIRFVRGQGEKIPFPDGAFDRITAVRSTHHMASPEGFFREAFRVLAAGGRLVVEERSGAPSFGWLFALVQRHRHHPTLDFRGAPDWENGLTRAGFVDVRTTRGPAWFLVTGRKRWTPTAEG